MKPTEKPTAKLRLIALAGLSISTMTLLSGCTDSNSSPKADAQSHDEHDGHDHDHDHGSHDGDQAQASTPDIYAGILGEITELPIEGDPSKSLKIHHQQIPNFKNNKGEINVSAKGVAGMGSMTMPFPLGQGLNLDGFHIGDKVSFTFQVNWGETGGAAWEVTQIEKIDPTTVIDYTNKIEEIKEAAEDMIDDAMDHSDHDVGTQGP